MFARKKIEEPGVECPREICIFVPMRGETSEVLPVFIIHYFGVIEFQTGNRIQRKRNPIADDDHGKRDPLEPHRAEAQEKEEHIAEPDLRKSILEGPVGVAAPSRTQKHTEQN